MMPNDRDTLQYMVTDLRAPAARYLRRHAKTHCPLVPAADLDAICNALGEVSVEEAKRALDRLQAEHAPPGVGR